jgi:hypothetical protein
MSETGWILECGFHTTLVVVVIAVRFRLYVSFRVVPVVVSVVVPVPSVSLLPVLFDYSLAQFSSAVSSFFLLVVSAILVVISRYRRALVCQVLAYLTSHNYQ